METDWRSKKLKTVALHWRGDIYFGHLKEIAPEYSNEIVLICKSFNPVKSYLVSLLIEKCDVELYADDSMDLTGRYHLARKMGNKLTYLTPEQESYIGKRMLRVYEMMVEDKILGEP